MHFGSWYKKIGSTIKKIIATSAAILFLMPQTVGSSSNMPDIHGSEQYVTGQEVCEKASAIGASLEGIRITGFACIDNEYIPPERLKALAESAGRLLAGSVLAQLSELKDGDFNGNNYTSLENKLTIGEINDTRKVKSVYIIADILYITVVLNNSPAGNGKEGSGSDYETYAAVDITAVPGDGINPSQLCGLCEKIRMTVKDFLKSYDKDTSVSTTYKLSFDDVMKYGLLDKIACRLFEDFGGSITEGAGDGSYISKTGYSPKIEGGILTHKGRINMNIALRNNNYDKKTYLWIGFPVINAEY